MQGLFSDSLPPFLRNLDAHSEPFVKTNFSYIHIDCDLYAGTRDVLTHLSDRISPGAILIFDELVNYPLYRHAGHLVCLSAFLSDCLPLQQLGFRQGLCVGDHHLHARLSAHRSRLGQLHTCVNG
jgi:hypothetical protein